MRAPPPPRSPPGHALRERAPPRAATARRAYRAGASRRAIEHGVDLLVGELEVLADRDRARQAPMCREEARPRRRGLDTNQARDRDAIARDVHLLAGFDPREEL